MSQLAFKPALQPISDRRVLIAEDNIVNQKLASHLLSMMGYQSDIASNGADALRLLALGSYDVVLMDLQMPVMDGLEATRAIRALNSPNRLIPIIAVTANTMQSDRDKCMAAGMNDFLCKPIEPAQFAATVQRWTNHTHRSDIRQGR